MQGKGLRSVGTLPAAAEGTEQLDLALQQAQVGFGQLGLLADQGALTVEQLQAVHGASVQVQPDKLEGALALGGGAGQGRALLAFAGIQRQGLLDVAQSPQHHAVEARQCAVAARVCLLDPGMGLRAVGKRQLIMGPMAKVNALLSPMAPKVAAEDSSAAPNCTCGYSCALAVSIRARAANNWRSAWRMSGRRCNRLQASPTGNGRAMLGRRWQWLAC